MVMLFWLFCAFTGQTPSLSPAGLERAIGDVLAQPHLQDGFWGVLVYAPSRGRFLVELNGHRNFRTASNLKILTSLLAFEYLGSDYVFQTILGSTTPPQNTLIEGDLVVRGGGDPSLSGRYSVAFDTVELITRMAASLKLTGIREVRGDLVADVSFFDDHPIQKSWEWDDIGQYYAVPITALSLNDGLYDFRFRADHSGSILTQIYPPNPGGLVLDDQLRSQGQSSSIRMRRPWGSNQFTVLGNLPACTQYQRSYAAWDPVLMFLQVFKAALAKQGIVVKGQLRVIKEATPLTLLTVWESDPLRVLARTLMVESQNHYADSFLKTTAQLVLGEGSFEAGAQLAGQLLARLARTPSDGRGQQMRDGSGMSAQNNLKPVQIIALLQHGLNAHYRPDWLASFPKMGEGTLSKRGSPETAFAVWAKTGYINRTRTLSGYVATRSGEPLIFSLLVNNYSCSTAKVEQAQDRICGLMRRLKLNRKAKRDARRFLLGK